MVVSPAICVWLVTISALSLSWTLRSSLILSSAVLSIPSCLALTSSSCVTRPCHKIVMSCDMMTRVTST